jgi:hypothetical protein
MLTVPQQPPALSTKPEQDQFAGTAEAFGWLY